MHSDIYGGNVLLLLGDANVFNISNGSGWTIIRHIKFGLPRILGNEIRIGSNKKHWFLTNMFLLFGFSSALFRGISDFALNMYYGFLGIHDFLKSVSGPRKIQYYLAVSTSFYGYGATVCSCCIFHAITRDLIRHIDNTENAILVRAKTRDDFYFYHKILRKYSYTEKMTRACRH